MNRTTSRVLVIIAGILGTIFSFWFGLNNHLLPEQASMQAPLVDDLFNVMVVIGTALFILTEGLIVYSMIRFRQPEGDETDGADIEGNLPLEIVWTAIPAVIVIGIGVYSVEVYEDMGGLHLASPPGHMHVQQPDAAETKMAGMDMAAMAAMPPGSAMAATMSADMAKTAPMIPLPDAKGQIASAYYGIGNRLSDEADEIELTVNVTGMQFAWLFEYPDLGITVGELHLPVDRRVRLQMKAVDVIHSFWVPQFRLKQDVIPGEETRLQFVATLPGTYPVFCAELCGSYHGSMRTQTIVHSEADYNEWVKTSQIAAKPSKVPMTVAQLSDEEYLAPYAQEIGLNSETLPKPPTRSF
jgi:cytochrome c oxidase subunit II